MTALDALGVDREELAAWLRQAWVWYEPRPSRRREPENPQLFPTGHFFYRRPPMEATRDWTPEIWAMGQTARKAWWFTQPPFNMSPLQAWIEALLEDDEAAS